MSDLFLNLRVLGLWFTQVLIPPPDGRHLATGTTSLRRNGEGSHTCYGSQGTFIEALRSLLFRVQSLKFKV